MGQGCLPPQYVHGRLSGKERRERLAVALGHGQERPDHSGDSQLWDTVQSCCISKQQKIVLVLPRRLWGTLGFPKWHRSELHILLITVGPEQHCLIFLFIFQTGSHQHPWAWGWRKGGTGGHDIVLPTICAPG